ncbi:biotin synthase BioB [Bordetella genomosp. 11]|uniref:Biotin synthase n=1 Tax=Bordetella genomosp. 11 TaxID=1416808 RepID=A0A261UYU5_9BORD|nr:biotin synthase BioB [Bordetella genomosp. 11]OZI67054.1 biotin synthase BioB [Bordetella genomosp. 11]
MPQTQTLPSPVAPGEAPREGVSPAAWTVDAIAALYALPFPTLMRRAQATHAAHFDETEIQLSSLLSIKTGGCPEDCGYCSQSSRHDSGLAAQPLMPLEEVLAAARAAQAAGARRFCMGAAWRSPKPRQVAAVARMVTEVKALGLETCVTLGMLDDAHARQLADAGLDYYNHNLDTSPEFYGKVITTRTYQDRLDTLRRVREAGIKVCCGGIVGMGEDRRARAGLIAQLANLDPYPESVPINNLMQVAGTPLYGTAPLDPFEFVRTVAVARIVMPRAMVRLSAGREHMDDATQALCFLAGANSIFYGEVLLTTANPRADADRKLLARLGMRTGDAVCAA